MCSVYSSIIIFKEKDSTANPAATTKEVLFFFFIFVSFVLIERLSAGPSQIGRAQESQSQQKPSCCTNW